MPQTGPPDVAIFLQQEIVMTAKYPSVRRRIPASLFTPSLALPIAADPAPASETADDAAAQVDGGSYGGEIVVTERRRQRSEEQTSAPQSLMRFTYTVFCL